MIKTHHNRVPVIEQMLREGRVVEPLADLYKVEVRELGRELGIPESAISRHPFRWLGVRASRRILASADDRESRSNAEATLAFRMSRLLRGGR